MGKVKLPFGNKYIVQDNRAHGITTDTQFLVTTLLKETERLADKPIQVLEIGTGNGIVSIMLALNRERWNITGIEVQLTLFNLAVANKKLTDTNFTLKLADIRKYKHFLNKEKFTLIVSNPPYHRVGTGRMPANTEKGISKFEFLSDMNDIFEGTNYLLEDDGFAYILYPASRMKDVRHHAAQNDLIIESVTTVAGDDDNALKNQANASTPGKEKLLFLLKKNTSTPFDISKYS